MRKAMKRDARIKTEEEIRQELTRIEDQLFIHQDDEDQFEYLGGYQDALLFVVGKK